MAILDGLDTHFGVESLLARGDRSMLPWSVVALQAPSCEITFIAKEELNKHETTYRNPKSAIASTQQHCRILHVFKPRSQLDE